MSRRARIGVVMAASIAVPLCGMALVPRLPQDPAYHNFADQRMLLGIPNSLNVLSNALLGLVGALGLLRLLTKRPASEGSSFSDARERWPYATFFLGVFLAAFGSAYYHWAPTNARLVWDRLPMTVAFTSLVAAVIAERISVRAGIWLLAPLLVAGLASVIYWHLGELRGHGDLRFYGFVQYGTVVFIPIIVLLFPPRYTRTLDLLAAAALYGLAKAFELLDRAVFDMGQIVSGHTLKHVAAGVACYAILHMLKVRRRAATGGTSMRQQNSSRHSSE